MSLAAYFSHSWKHEDTPINLAIWQALSSGCRLLIDRPPLAEESENPPYFISRIEALMRRSDVFVCCLPAKPREKCETPTAGAKGDWRYWKFSPYILFEIRMAERVGIPRFIVYDIESGFQPPPNAPSHSKYIGVRFGEVRKLIENGEQYPSISSGIENWLNELAAYGGISKEFSALTAGILLDKDSDKNVLDDSIREALFHAGIDEIINVSDSFVNDAAISERFRTLSLLVADLSTPRSHFLYGVAHAHVVPTIRLFEKADPDSQEQLPLLLQGHPAGYQYDLVEAKAGDEFFEGIRMRADSAVSSAAPIDGLTEGQDLIRQRTYKRHFVFISHASKQDDRMKEQYGRGLVDAILNECRLLSINVWEYDIKNRSGEDWEIAMNEALEKMTHFVPLITPEYADKDRTMCVKEVNCANERWKKENKDSEDERTFRILPFLVGKNTAADLVKFEDEKVTKERLSEDRPHEVNAKIVAQRILASVIRS